MVVFGIVCSFYILHKWSSMMPKPIEILFDLLNKKKYEEIIPLIKEHVDLVNAVDPDGYSLFQLLLTTKVTDQSKVLLQFVSSHADLDLAYENVECGLTNIDELISSIKVDVFQTVLNNSKSLFNRDKLTYESAKDYLTSVQKSHQRDLQKDPNSTSSARSKVRVANMEEIISMIRDATILHAISTDDANLLDRLEKAGASCSERLGKLGKEKLPTHLLTAKNTNIKTWFKTRNEQSNARLGTNPNSFHNSTIAKLESQLADLDTQYLQSKTAVHLKAQDHENELIGRLVTALK